MTDEPLNPPEPVGIAKLRELAGEEAPADQDAVVDPGEIGDLAEATDTARYELTGDDGPPDEDLVPELESFESLGDTGERTGETDDPDVAAEEGLAWVPPIDPPVVADSDASGGIAVAAGFGTTAEDEPFDLDHHSEFLPATEELVDRVHEALVADARTSRLAEQVAIDTIGGVVILTGTVDDLEDTDLLVEVAGAVSGVTDVRDETEVAGL
jgi:hypothetical protein